MFATGSPPYLKRSPICPQMDLPMATMALIKAFAGALGGTFADQWLDIITVGQFGEHVALMPGVYQETNQGGAAGAVFVPAGLGDDAFDARLVEDERGRVLRDIDA